MLLQENTPLASFTTFGVGGAARWFVQASSEEEIAEAAAWAGEHAQPLFVLGGGSNLLVADGGFNGIVVHIALTGITRLSTQQDAAQVIYQAAAGESWDGFVECTVADNCAGIECLAGIPGTVGGTPVQNVGAYGQEVASSIECVRAYDLMEHRFVEFSAAECGFAYRRSRFNSTDRGRYVVTRVDYRLTQDGKPTLLYSDLQRSFRSGANPTLAEVAAAVRHVRQAKGMLLVEGDPNCRSAGSFFKNPVATDEQVRHIASVCGEDPPRFPAGPEHQGAAHKIPAAWLIEHAGFAKGYTLGAAGLSSRHTLALINRGGASAQEILALATQIADTVETHFGIRLEMEPVLVGF